MFEHVGLKNLPRYFGVVRRLLRPGGAVLNQGITVTDPSGKSQGPPGGEFIDRHVFPGGELPHLSRLVLEHAKAGLELAEIEDLRPHYAQTLRHWLHRLEARTDEARRLVGEGPLRIWPIYMAGMAMAFDRGWLTIDQLLSYKPVDGRPAPRPWTIDRAYRGLPEP